jgi:hypothetical protein
VHGTEDERLAAAVHHTVDQGDVALPLGDVIDAEEAVRDEQRLNGACVSVCEREV